MVSVVIVNYNSGPMLYRCVSSLCELCEPAQEVIVVDNASSDDSLQNLTSRSSYPFKLKVFQNDKNLGFAAACNIGIRSLSADRVLFLNPDCSLSENALTRMIAVLECDENIGMIGGFLCDPDGAEQEGGRRCVPTPWRSLVRGFGLYHFADRFPVLFFDFHLHKQFLPDCPIEVEAISGACMLVRREALDDVGPLDEGYFMHCEDLDWCMRFRQKGWKIMFVPDAKVIHHKGTCSKTRPYFVEWHKHKGMMRFYRKFFRQQYPGILMWLVGLGIWLRYGLVGGHHFVVRNMGRKK